MKKIMYKILEAMLVACMVLTMVGCGNEKNGEDGVNSRTITDMSGRQLEIPQNISKYAISWVGATDILVMLDDCEGMVAYPKTSSSYLKFVEKYVSDDIAMLPKENISAEEIIGTGAEVVFARMADIEGIVEQLETAGVVVIDVEFTNYEEMLKAVELCANVLGSEKAKEKATSYIKYGEDTLAMINDLIANQAENAPTALAIRDAKDFRAYGPGRFAGKWIEICGFRCPLETDDPEAYVNLTAEELTKYDPDYIFFALPNEASVMLGDSTWSGLKAYNEGKIYNCPEIYNTWCNQGSESLLQLYWACGILYGDSAPFDTAEVVKEFYSEFYDLALSDEEVQELIQ